jgi:hypothetical protein
MTTVVSSYLEHLLDPIGLRTGILIDVGTKDHIGIGVALSLLAYVISQLIEDCLRNICVQIVYENSFRHFILFTLYI